MREVSDLEMWASGAEGRTRQTVKELLVSKQKRDLRGLASKRSTGSAVISGRAGTVNNCLAAEVGKYIGYCCITEGSLRLENANNNSDKCPKDKR